MVKGLYTAYTGMLNEQHRMDVLTNNLANADTNGFKKEGATSQSFDAILAYKIKDSSEGYQLAKRIGYNHPGVKIGEGYTDFSQGPMKNTGNTFDLALTDKGFFAVEFTNKSGESSVKYTRDGNFTLTNWVHSRSRRLAPADRLFRMAELLQLSKLQTLKIIII